MKPHELVRVVDKKYRISQKYGNLSPVTGKKHSGTDYACPIGTDVLAIEDGTVVETWFDSKGAGNAQALRIDWSPYEVLDQRNYHLSKYIKVKGQSAKKGETIAKSGNSGVTSGPHEHLTDWFRNKNNLNEIYEVDPELVESGQIKGHFTPLSYWENTMDPLYPGTEEVRRIAEIIELTELYGDISVEDEKAKKNFKDWLYGMYQYYKAKNFRDFMSSQPTQPLTEKEQAGVDFVRALEK